MAKIVVAEVLEGERADLLFLFRGDPTLLILDDGDPEYLRLSNLLHADAEREMEEEEC